MSEVEDKKIIKTIKRVYPQIYSYILPNRPQNRGWQKIGYTERKDVNSRIREQVKTAAFNEEYQKLWSASAVFEPPKNGNFFKDYDFHDYLIKNGIRKDEGNGKEWFYFNGEPEKSKELFEQFRQNKFEFVNLAGKIKYTLREEQANAVEATLEYAQNNQTTDFENPNPRAEFLWNAKPRFGKTLTTYDFAKKLNAKNVLIVTNRPAIANSWFDDFEKFIDGYYFISTADSLKDRQTLTRDDFNRIDKTDKKQFTFLSLQDLKGGKIFGGGHDKLEWVADLSWDLLVIDEAHEGIDTGRTDEAFENIKRRFTLHLSGTPFRALAGGKFTENQIFNWTYIDEQRAKEAEFNRGEDSGAHTDMPDMRLFTYKISEMLTEKINEGVNVDGEHFANAFDLNELFATDKHGKFIHEGDVKKFIDRLSGNEKYPFSTPELRNELKHTFWLVGNRVSSAKALEKLLREHPVFENYKIILAAGDGKKMSDDDNFTQELEDEFQNQKALDRVRDAIKKYDKTITLSVGQLTTGVTVKEWSAVLMLSEIKSESLYMQTIFRSQNPYKVLKNGEIYRKKSAYVFDFAPERVLRTYDAFANSLIHTGATGKITDEERKNNVAKLLNYFPVISEDEDGKMIELDAEQVLTFPKTIIARDVVNHRFLTNLLFRNITNVYNIPSEIRASLNKLRETNDAGKVATSEPKSVPEDKQRRERTERKISQNRQVIFGQKVYGNEIVDLVEETFADGVLNFANRFTEKIEKEITEPIYEKFVETYSPSKSEIAQIKKDHIKKIREVVDDFVASPQELKDKKVMTEKISTIIEDDMPRDLVDEREEKVFEKEEETELNMIKSKLKTFSRAIPSFVMASNDPKSLTIDNIEESVNDADFEALFTERSTDSATQPFTKEDFRLIRDGYNNQIDLRPQGFDGFFDKYVFNAAIHEFEAKRESLANYLLADQKEDIFSYIPPQKSNQIFTPRKVVNKMLNILEKENPGIFNNPNTTFADLHIKSGLYLAEIAKRLFRGLESQIPDRQARIKHIFERQLYGFAPTNIIYDIAKNYIYAGFQNINTSNLQQKDLTNDFKEGRTLNMKFDVVIGNPPYQEEVEGRGEQPPIYHYFMEEAYKIADKVCFITPARFLFNAGMTPKKFNQKMLNDKHLKVAHFEQNSDKIFPGTDIKGGVAITYRDKSMFFGRIGVFTHFDELNSIIHKVVKKEGSDISEIMFGNTSYRYSSKIYEENPEIEKVLSGGSRRYLASSVFDKISNLFFENKLNDKFEYVQIYGRQNNERVYKYFRRDYLQEHENLDKFKVIVPSSNGSGAIGEVLSTPLIGAPLIGHTETFISFGAFEARDEAENCLKYIKSKFARTMLGTLKVTQGNKRKEVWKNVPLQDFTSNSDIDWSQSVAQIDQQLYKKYGLSEQEIAFIEEKVRAME